MRIFKVSTEYNGKLYDSKNVAADTCMKAIKRYLRKWTMLKGERVIGVELVAKED